MALFGNKKQREESVVDQVDAVVNTAQISVNRSDDVLLRPHVTEKAYALSNSNVYTFVIAPDANKHMVAQAVARIYNVTPVRVNIVKKRPRLVRSIARAHASKQAGLKKAYVYLKEGDTISFM